MIDAITNREVNSRILHVPFPDTVNPDVSFTFCASQVFWTSTFTIFFNIILAAVSMNLCIWFKMLVHVMRFVERNLSGEIFDF